MRRKETNTLAHPVIIDYSCSFRTITGFLRFGFGGADFDGRLTSFRRLSAILFLVGRRIPSEALRDVWV